MFDSNIDSIFKKIGGSQPFTTVNVTPACIGTCLK